MQRSEALPIIEREAGRLLELAADPEVDRASTIPSCPGWSFDDLLTHLGRVYAMVASALGDEAGGPPDRGRIPRRPEQQDPGEWLRERLELLLPLLHSTHEDDRRWNFVEGPRSPVAFWWRRQVHETTIHRVDAELAAACPIGATAPGVAADGIRERLLIAGFSLVPWQDLQLGDGLTIHLHATDAAGAEWTIDAAGGSYAEAHLKADVALRGPAWSLDRWIWRRGVARTSGDEPDRHALPALVDLEAFGDLGAAESWLPTF